MIEFRKVKTDGVVDDFDKSEGKIKQLKMGYELFDAPGILEHGMYQKYKGKRGRSYKFCTEAVPINKRTSEKIGMTNRKSDWP